MNNGGWVTIPFYNFSLQLQLLLSPTFTFDLRLRLPTSTSTKTPPSSTFFHISRLASLVLLV